MNNDSEMDLLSLLDDYFILQADPLLNDQNNETDTSSALDDNVEQSISK